MATPDRYISISDFTPGIWGDLQAASTVRGTADDNLAGAVPTNGRARVQGTSRCHADKSGALIPLPKAQFLEARQKDSQPTNTTPATGYLLDAIVGISEGFETSNSVGYFPVYVLWGFTHGDGHMYVRGRMYDQVVGGGENPFDFLMVRQNAVSSPRLPAGSFTNSRFYYGYTTPGLAEAAGDTTFRVRWWYPVTVALVSSPFSFDSEPQKHDTGTISVGSEPEPRVALNIGSSGSAAPYTTWSPSIGGAGNGGLVLGMRFNNGDTTNLPLPTTRTDLWYFHYNDASHVHGADLDEAPNTPFMLLSHQQRIVMPDRKLSSKFVTHTISGSPNITYDIRAADDLLWYSDPALPMQDFTKPSTTKTYSYADGDATGDTNVGYASTYPACIQNSYNKITLGDDQFAEVGTIGVVNYDQLIVVKHAGGGVVVAGDLDSPTVRRLPFIESTGGLVHKGVATPLGFVYGSPNGIYVWAGGEQTEKLSQQIDGFFWDHTDGTDAERYAGSRGKFGYWNDLILVPNNYAYDTVTNGWWRMGVTSFYPTDPVGDPHHFNVYDTAEGTLFAFAYKWELQASAGGNARLTFAYYDPLVLDIEYTWQSHPLIESRGRRITVQEVTLVATGHTAASASIKVTLNGIERDGVTGVSTTLTFNLAQTDDPQLLRLDVPGTFQAEYVTVSLEAKSNDTTTSAPKIHSVNLGIKERGITPRHG